jgi:hypothetical protein
LYDNRYPYTHFTGFMLDEEIGASLWGSTSSATQTRKRERSHEFFGGKFEGEGKIIHSCSNSLRNGNFLTKICQCMQLNLLNTLS